MGKEALCLFKGLALLIFHHRKWTLGVGYEIGGWSEPVAILPGL